MEDDLFRGETPGEMLERGKLPVNWPDVMLNTLSDSNYRFKSISNSSETQLHIEMTIFEASND